MTQVVAGKQYIEEYEKEKRTKARIQAVTPVPHEVTTGLSKEIPAEHRIRIDL